MASIKCTGCGLLNPDSEPVCRRCGEVLVLDESAGWDADGPGVEPADHAASAYATPSFPAPIRDEARDSAARAGRMVGVALVVAGTAGAAAGVATSKPQIVLCGAGMTVAGGLAMVGGIAGLYFLGFTCLLSVLYATGVERGRLDARKIVLLQSIFPALLLAALWWRWPARLRGEDLRPRRSAYNYTPDGRMLSAYDDSLSPAVRVLAIVAGVVLLAVTIWGAFLRQPTYEGQPVSYWTMRIADPNPAVRRAAADALGRINTRDTIAPLATAMSDDDPGVRRAAVEALRRKSDEEAGRRLKLGLWSDFKDVREWSLAALGDRDLYTAAESQTDAERANRVQPPRK